jgi:hypothetical protein
MPQTLSTTFTETKEIDIQNLSPQIFPRQGVYFGQYSSILEGTSVPALLPIGETNGICFLQTQGNRDIIYKTMQSIILRLLLQINSGLLKLTLYDSTGFGRNLIGLSQIDKNIKGENILTDQSELKRALEAAVADMQTTIQKVLGHKFVDKTLIDYNEDAGKQAKPYHIICLTDFPNGLNKEHLDLIDKIVQNGKQAGVFIILGLDTEFTSKNSYDGINVFPLLHKMGVVYEADNRWYVKNIHGDDFINKNFNLYLDNYFPDSDLLEKIQGHITTELKKVYGL